MRLGVGVPLFLACGTWFTPAFAYRPFDGTDADVAERGEFELEFGPSHYYRRGERNYLIAPATVLNLGILEGTEIVVDFQDFVALDPDAHPRLALLGNDVLLKHVFRRGVLQGASGVSIAAEAGPLVPELDGADAFGASLDTIISYRWPALTVHFNEWAEYTRSHNPFVFTGVIVEGPHDWAVRPVAELFYSHEWDVGDEASALVGGIWTLRDSFTVDLGVRGSRVLEANAAEIRLGFTLVLPVWGHVENAGLAADGRAYPSGSIPR
ncbi:MAG TPA: hypothetical protein VHU80_17865 [Polyangiaceae bacterium]|jgi:hypothetical protein|nr:hypothetical protein [Polyangiaceae bacterium]